MPDNQSTRSIGRLENLQSGGAFEKAQEALRKPNPILDELGISRERAKEALRVQPGQLESMGTIRPIELEAIVVVTNRPPLLIKDDTVLGVDALPDVFPATTPSKIAGVEPLIPSVGRIEFIDFVMPWGGTGWVIDRESNTSFIIATNRHVAKIIALRRRDGSGAFKFDRFTNIRYGASIDFFEENGATSAQSREVRIEKFTYIADNQAADVALARIEVTSGHQIAPLPLAEKPAKNDELLAVVGYPGNSPRDNDVGALERYFQRLYDVKRFSPGFARVSSGSTSLLHDCTTLGGNSGSPVISLDQQSVVGLHFSGTPGTINRAVQI
ncbi:MAG: trypsin-like serine peptidase, partial [Rhizobiaceae bacterium]